MRRPSTSPERKGTTMSITNVRSSTMGRVWGSALGLVVTLVMGLAGRAAATDVTACGQTLVPRDTGVLQVDLDCPDSASAVFLGDRATLAFGGHTITRRGRPRFRPGLLVSTRVIHAEVGHD